MSLGSRSARSTPQVLRHAHHPRPVMPIAGLTPAMMGAAVSEGTGALLGVGLFAAVALILVAALAYLLGRQSARAGLTGAPWPSTNLESPAPRAQGERAPQVQNGGPDAGAASTLTPAATPQAGPALAPVSAPAIAPVSTPAFARPGAAQTPNEGGNASEAQASAYTVSHDLRAPLRVVEGFARILKEDHGRQLDRIGNDHLDRVLAASARMNAMIEAMLTMARISSQPLSRQQVNLSQIARFVLEDLQESSPGRALRIEIEEGLMVTADPILMRQLMENLLSNAWKYTAQVEMPCICVRSLTDSLGRRVIEVADNGAGFDMRSADRLFGLFQRLHAAHDFPGTGVGLASVQRIVRRHGGDIWADSAPGQGARFQFTLG